jgi:hypothetical protein
MAANSVVAPMPVPRCSTLFSPSKHRASRSKRNTLALARVVVSVMERELSQEAQRRWKVQLDEALGETFFGPLKAPKGGCRGSIEKRAAPPTQESACGTVLAWAPRHTKLALLILAAFQHKNELLADGKPALLSSLTADGKVLSKIMAKRTIAWIQQTQPEAFAASGELTREQLGDMIRLQKVVGRTSADVFAYVQSIVMRDAGGVDGGVVLELHNTDQRLSGLETRGSGIVLCEKGLELFEGVVAKTLACFAGVDGAEE